MFGKVFLHIFVCFLFICRENKQLYGVCVLTCSYVLHSLKSLFHKIRQTRLSNLGNAHSTLAHTPSDFLRISVTRYSALQ